MSNVVQSKSLLFGLYSVLSKLYYCLTVSVFLNDDCNVGFSLRRKEMIKWFLGAINEKCVFSTVRTVKGSVQVLRVYLQLSNLDFWVWLQKDREDNNLWLTNKRDPVCTDHLARATFRFWCVCFTLSLLTGIGVCSVVLSATQVGPRWTERIHTNHVWSVLPQRREWFTERHVGFLSNFQQFLLWLCAIHWCNLI